MWRDVKRVIEQGRRFILTTHINPDGDGIGSAAALIELLHFQKKQVSFVCDSPISEKYQFLNFHGLFSSYSGKENISPFDVLIVLDTFKEERIGRVSELLQIQGTSVVCIDHHATDQTLAPISVIDREACSVGAMIYTLFKESGFDLNYEAAMGIYTSVITDTGRFSYASTSTKAHKMAYECLKVGIDPSQMYARLFQQVPVSQIQVFQRILPKMEIHFDGRVVVQQVRFLDYQDFCDTPNQLSLIQDFDYIHEFNKSIQGIECAVILWELPCKNVRVSLRSNSHLDIVEPMKNLGGGGHRNAAGAVIHSSFDSAKKTILDLLALQLNSL